MLPDSVYHLHGFLSPAEMQYLYDAATAVPKGGAIVEIGSFQGKSTVCLGLGAKESGANVWAIDPHDDLQVNNQTHYGMENHAALLMNLCLQGLADTVRVIAFPSYLLVWLKPIDLLWIDGSHEFEDVQHDLMTWSDHVSPNGRILIHDTSGHFAGVTRALTEFLMERPWKLIQQIDSIAVLEREHV